MASGIDWFRWHHGAITDPKFQLIAKKANARFGDVIALWAFVLEMASADSDRGNIGQIDFETLDYMLGAEEGTAIRILDAMTARGLIVGNRIAAWEKRQPRRERENDNSTERSKAFRDKQRHATPCNANENQETPREEESREEESKPLSNANALDVLSVAEEPAEPEAESKKLPSCPHQKVIDLYHESLPYCPQVREWNTTRQKYLQSRWREKAVSLGWQQDTEGLDWFKRFFAFVGESKFLTGKADGRSGKPPFLADLEWLMKPSNFSKVVEGKYHQ